MSKRKADDALSESKPPHSMRGKVLLITGGAQGLGLEVARMASGRGATGIVLVDKNATNSKEAVQDVEKHGDAACLFVQCDVGDPKQIEDAVAQAEGRFGRIDGLVNAAGDTARGDLDSTSVEQWDRQHNVNLRSVFLFTKHVSQLMKRTKVHGSIGMRSRNSRNSGPSCEGLTDVFRIHLMWQSTLRVSRRMAA